MVVKPQLSDVIATLRQHEVELSKIGIRHVAVFGSVARGEQTERSDVDLMVDVDEDVVKTIFDLGGIHQSFCELLGREVDVSRRDRMRAHVQEEAEREAVRAF